MNSFLTIVGRKIVTNTEDALENPVGTQGLCAESGEGTKDTIENQMQGANNLPRMDCNTYRKGLMWYLE